MDQDIRPIGTLESTATCFGVAVLAGVGAFAMLLLLADWSLLQAVFGGAFVIAILTPLLALTIGRPRAAPTTVAGRMRRPTEDRARAEMPGRPGEAAMPDPVAPRDLNAPSPHRDAPDRMPVSDARGGATRAPAVSASVSPGPGGTPAVEAVPATRIPAPAAVNSVDPALSRAVGATTGAAWQLTPTPLNGAVISPEAPADARGEKGDLNALAPSGGAAPRPTATHAAQSYNEVDPLKPARTGAADGAGAAARAGSPEPSGADASPDTRTTPADADARRPAATAALDAGAASPASTRAAEAAAAAASPPSSAAGATDEGVKPETLDAPRGGSADDLKRIKGIGPKLETLCNRLGFWHFDQIASWSDEEVRWVDQHLEGFRGRVSRDEWVSQARHLAGGGETAFSRKVDGGDVY